MELLLAPWLMNAAFRGRALNGWQSADTWPVWSGSSNQVEQKMYQEGMEAVCIATGESRSSLLNVIDPERYSSLSNLLAVTSHVIRFKTNCKSGMGKLKKIWLLLLSIGPGLFCIGYTIGTGSVTSMLKAGSLYGMQLLWVLVLSAFFSGVLMDTFGKMSLVTGKPAIYTFRT